VAEAAIARADGGMLGKGADFLRLCKPKVVALIVFTAAIGMMLAAVRAPTVNAAAVAAAFFGILLAAGSAAAFNCIFEHHIDAAMRRTRSRPLPCGRLTPFEALAFASFCAGAGLSMLNYLVNPLTMWLTLATFFGYAVVYTLLLKPSTPQNIVIGGASGAMPPVLGWTAVTGEVTYEPLLLFLIIFLWTPPHFWALAIYRGEEYRKAGIPMLPVTHGRRFTALQVFLYAIVLAAASLLPFVTGMSGWIYLAVALVSNGRFVRHAWRVWRSGLDSAAKRMFTYSIAYLFEIFAALLADAYLGGALARALS
jgi:protoheme IX farnesyltransferase